MITLRRARPPGVIAPWSTRVWRGRLRIALEILFTYGSFLHLRLLRGAKIRDAIGELRDRRLARPPARWGRDDEPVRLGRATWKLLRFLPGDTHCLTQSIVLSALLARRGRSSKIVLAVSGPKADALAHAWVEFEGRDLLPGARPGDQRLTEL
jgi:hypothetical protein